MESEDKKDLVRYLYFVRGKTLKSIAEFVGLSRPRIHQIIKERIKKKKK